MSPTASSPYLALGPRVSKAPEVHRYAKQSVRGALADTLIRHQYDRPRTREADRARRPREYRPLTHRLPQCTRAP
jgi:hypothetical protein